MIDEFRYHHSADLKTTKANHGQQIKRQRYTKSAEGGNPLLLAQPQLQYMYHLQCCQRKRSWKTISGATQSLLCSTGKPEPARGVDCTYIRSAIRYPLNLCRRCRRRSIIHCNRSDFPVRADYYIYMKSATGYPAD